MWRVLFVSIVTAATVCAAEGQDQRISGNDLLDACRVAANGATPSDNSLKVGMCLGELDALNWIMPGIYHEDVRSCIPEQVTRPQMAKVVVDYMDRNHPKLGEPFQGLALEAFVHSWPCPPQPGWFESWFK